MPAVPVGPVSQRDATQALRRTLPRTADAVRLFDLVEQRLGDRALRDDWVFPAERALLLRDPAHPDWVFPQRVLYLHLDYAIPVSPPPTDPAVIEWMASLASHEEDEPIALSRPTPPARLRLQEGTAYLDVTYDARGRWLESMMTVGDLATFGHPDRPLAVDPDVRPPQEPPLSWFARADLDTRGHPVEDLAESFVAHLPPERGRVHVPAPTPGGVVGCWDRGVQHLRAAGWEGRLPTDGGWLVIDAFNGTAAASGPTFEAAVAAWRATVARVQPLPPVERPVELPDPLPEPVHEVERDPDDPRKVSFHTEVHLVFYPPMQRPWPEARPENVPAVALPVARAPSVPAGLAAIGFERVVPLFGEHGDGAFAFVRDEPHGHTVIGEEAAATLDPTDLDARLDRLDEARRAEHLEMPFFRDDPPWERAEYPVHVHVFTVRDGEVRVADTSWTGEISVLGWTDRLTAQIVRLRRR